MSAKHKQQTGIQALRIVRQFFPGVVRVNDATRPIEIEVTPQDCAKSVALDHRNCALAVGAKRSTGADGVIIAMKTAYLIKGHTATRYKLAEYSSREIISFDRKGGFAEGEYTLIPPKPYQQLGNFKPTGPKNKTGTKRKMHFTKNVRTRLNVQHQDV